MKLLRRKTPAAAALVLVLSMLIVPVAAQAQSGSGIAIPIVGTIGTIGTIGTTGTFSGAFNLMSFAVRDGQVLCAVAGLLDNPGGLSRLLNQILGILG